MAKYDAASLSVFRKLSSDRRRRFEHFRKVYHILASISRELKTNQDKIDLVTEHPEIAASIFYYFNDNVLGGMIVRQFLSDYNDERRTLAQRVSGVLGVRKHSENSLENVLGMHLVFDPSHTSDSLEGEGYIENVYRALEIYTP